ncbi:MAG: cyclic nucleotide-binding domain-containing protein [Alphaproteobacteria bacterium]|jgi:CRP-like cAMP-binding protein|nr:cyclic nucleotide-binding domain-containing protein [Alphaproteobacteria bacterium]
MPTSSDASMNESDLSGVIDMLVRYAPRVDVPQGARLFAAGRPVDMMPFLLTGTVRSEDRAGSGPQNVLCRARAGEGCGLITACILAQQPDNANVIAETDVAFVAISRDSLNALLSVSSDIRARTFRSVCDHLADLSTAIEDRVLSQRMA